MSNCSNGINKYVKKLPCRITEIQLCCEEIWKDANLKEKTQRRLLPSNDFLVLAIEDHWRSGSVKPFNKKNKKIYKKY